MLEKTDLDNCKRVAKIFLGMEIETTSDFFQDIISHPFFQSIYVSDEKNEKLLNILEDEKSYDTVIKQMEEKIDKVEKYMDFTLLLTRPYRLIFLKCTMEYLDKRDFSNYLIDTWINDEYANMNANVSKMELLQFFKIASKEYLMDEDEFDIYNGLEREITVYRGVTDYNRKNVKALSWTVEKEKAKWFSKRFKENGYVYMAKINKNDVLAYCDKRNEKEIILDYTKLYDVELLEEL